MAKAPLARVGQRQELNILWQPFELRPDPVPLLDPDGEYIRNAFQNSVLPLAKQLGVRIEPPKLSTRTRLAHEAAAYAEQMGRLPEMSDALFRAYWHDGRDIGQVEVLCDIGLSVGLDPVALRAALEERSMRESVEEGLARSHAVGITAVPTFVVGGRFLLRGLVSEEQLERAIALCQGEGLVQLD